MATGVRVERTLAHEPMHAGFGAQIAVGIIAGHLHARALDAGDFAFGFLEDLGLVAAALAVAQVHAQQHGRPVLCLGAATPRLNVDEAWIRVHRIVEHPAELHVSGDPLQFGDVAFECTQSRVVTLCTGKLEKFRAVLEPAIEIPQRGYDAIQLFLFATELLRALGVVPDLRILESLDDCLQPLRLGVEVKDTSANRQRVAADLQGGWRAD